jgi:hypothetical protein
MSKNPSYTTLTKGSTFYLDSTHANHGVKVKATRLRLNKYETIVEYEGHNGVRFITGEVTFSKWGGSSHVIVGALTDEQKLAFANATAKRVAAHAKGIEKEQKERAHAEAFIAKHKAETEAPLVWSEPTRSVGNRGRLVRYSCTATRTSFWGCGFDIRLETGKLEVCADLYLQSKDSGWDEVQGRWVEQTQWVLMSGGGYGRMELETALAHYKCLEMALKELNDLSVAEPNAPVAEPTPEAVAA